MRLSGRRSDLEAFLPPDEDVDETRDDEKQVTTHFFSRPRGMRFTDPSEGEASSAADASRAASPAAAAIP